MPTYEYSCQACGRKFSSTMSFAEHERRKPKCPKCGSARVAQRFTSFFAKTSRKS